jgi:RNA polymerase sigma-70 factor (ECF subfamily)
VKVFFDPRATPAKQDGESRKHARNSADDALEAELVERWSKGDQRAFREVYQRYAPVLARRLRRILWRESEVEDLLQMTFLEAHRSLDRFRRDAPLGAWLHGIATNVVGRHLRATRRKSWLLSSEEAVQRQPEEQAPSPEQSTERRQRAEILYRAMDELPDKKRIAFALHEIEGLGLSEIAAMTRSSPQTIWARVESAREFLTRRLGRLLADPTETATRSQTP